MITTSNTILSASWVLAHDATVSGDFNGAMGVIGTADAEIFIASGAQPAPVAGTEGIRLPEPPALTSISLGRASGDKLYVRASTGQGVLQLVSRLGLEGLPFGIFEGTRAMQVQGYIEANVKNGAQFEYAAAAPITLAANGQNGDTAKLILKTGANRIAIKSRTIQFNGAGITASVYEGAIYTEGTGTVAPIYNMRRRPPVPVSTVTIIAGATITNDGTIIAAPTVALGSTGRGQTVQGSFSVQGVERWLEATTVYMLSIKNNDTSPCQVAPYATFYDGAPDFPL